MFLCAPICVTPPINSEFYPYPWTLVLPFWSRLQPRVTVAYIIIYYIIFTKITRLLIMFLINVCLTGFYGKMSGEHVKSQKCCLQQETNCKNQILSSCIVACMVAPKPDTWTEIFEVKSLPYVISYTNPHVCLTVAHSSSSQRPQGLANWNSRWSGSEVRNFSEIILC